MHARHKSPGNGYRSNSMGMGMGASRISPDSSGRAHGFYKSEYRSFNNRGFGRGQGGRHKSFQQPPQPPPIQQKGDILMEAGRLATEYLVSKGLLPPSALSGKWQNGAFKKQAGEYQEFRQQEDLLLDGRTSALARVGSRGSFDTGSGWRRYSDDFTSRNQMGGRRRGEYYRSYSSEWPREYGRNGPWSDRNRASPDMEGEEDSASGQHEDHHVDPVIDGIEKSDPIAMEPVTAEAANMESGPDKSNPAGELDPNEIFSCAGKDKTDGEHYNNSEVVTNFDLGNAETYNNKCNEIEKRSQPDDIPSEEHNVDDGVQSESITDLAALCKFSKVPTKMRSALTSRNSKVDRTFNNEEQINPDCLLPRGSEGLVHEGTLGISTTDAFASTTAQSYMCPSSRVSEEVPVQSAKDASNSGPSSDSMKCLRSQSFPHGAFLHDNENESSKGLPVFGMSTSVEERCEKRIGEGDDRNEAAKKPREWLSSLVSKAEGQMPLANLTETGVRPQLGKGSPDQRVISTVNQDSLVSSFQFAGDIKYAQEKQLFPSSFKICDLNLMETSNVNDNHHGDTVLIYPPFMNVKNEAESVDIDLSISNSNVTGEYARNTSSCKEIEVIDLENDSSPEHRDFGQSQRKVEEAFAGTEGVPSNAHNAGGIADVQDNYDGLMISEFLNTFSNCASATEDINPLQSGMGLHNEEGTLGDDDSIYMSLDEIPLSFIPAWRQPTPQEYEKPF